MYGFIMSKNGKFKTINITDFIDIGFIQQATKEGCEPFIPAISLYKYGGLAKWAPKIQAIELRLNDPGLKFYKNYFHGIITDAKRNRIKIVLSFPEYKPEYLLAPPERTKKTFNENTNLENQDKTNKQKFFIWFKRAFLVTPYNYPEKSMCYELTLDDCNKVIDLAHEYQIDRVVVPISEPALFLDQRALSDLTDKLVEIAKIAQKYNIKLYLKNGGISFDYLKKLCDKISAKMAINIAYLYLEKFEFLELFEKFSDYCEIFYLCQVTSGIEEYNQRRENLIKSIINYKKQLDNFMPYSNKPYYDKDRCAAYNNLKQSYGEFLNCCKSMDFNLLLTQNGKISYTYFYKSLSKELTSGKHFTIFLETYPHIKNIELIRKNLFPEAEFAYN